MLQTTGASLARGRDLGQKRCRASGALAPSPGLWLQEEQGDLGCPLIAMTFCWGWLATPALHSRGACRTPRAYCVWGGQQELEAIKLKLWTMEQAEALQESACVEKKATEEERAEVRQLLSPETIGRNLGPLLTLSPEDR